MTSSIHKVEAQQKLKAVFGAAIAHIFEDIPPPPAVEWSYGWWTEYGLPGGGVLDISVARGDGYMWVNPPRDVSFTLLLPDLGPIENLARVRKLLNTKELAE